MTRPRVWQPPAWYAYPAGRLRFLAELRARGIGAAQTRISRADRKHRGGFQVEFTMTVPGLAGDRCDQPLNGAAIVTTGIGPAPVPLPRAGHLGRSRA